MKIMKLKLLIFCFIALTCFLVGEERRKPVPLNELKNPESKRYVPIPYPKTKEEIIKDLKYAMKYWMMVPISERIKHFFGIPIPERDEIVLRFLKKDPDITVSSILKIKNRISGSSHDYSILVELSDINGEPMGRISMNANGMYTGSVFCCKKYNYRLKKLKTEDQIRKLISNYSIPSLNDSNIKKIEPMLLSSIISDNNFPSWEIVCNDNKVFYVSGRGDIFRIHRRIRLKEDEMKKKDFNKFLKSKYDILAIDTINDEVLILRMIKK